MPRAGDGGALTAEGLSRLLERLHPDPDEAARAYEHLRRALVRFFEWRGAWPPDECADVTLDRLGRRLEEDTSIDDVRQYAHGIARLVLLERQRRPPTESLDDVARLRLVQPEAADDEGDSVRECFERCLAGVPADGRSLLLSYYQGERAVKIANRRRLATALGLTDNALRSRVQRLRDRLEQCIGSCLSRLP